MHCFDQILKKWPFLRSFAIVSSFCDGIWLKTQENVALPITGMGILGILELFLGQNNLKLT